MYHVVLLPVTQDREMTDEVVEAIEVIIDALTPANDREILVGLDPNFF